MKKAETLEHWEALAPDQPILPHFEAIPYGSKGSTYGACGIRIDGTPQFIDAVMSHLKELIAGESDETRLQLSRNIVDGSGLGKALNNKSADAECCYIRLCERGGEAKVCNAIIRAHRNAKGAAK